MTGSSASSPDVSTHFRIPILSGQSSFTVRVPHYYLQGGNRRFFFSQLHLAPDFFSLDAEKQKLDADPEMDRVLEMEVHVKINYGDPKTTYVSEPFNNSPSVKNTVDVVAAINNYFESKKPDFSHTTPLFMDWIDIMADKQTNLSETMPKMGVVYYNTQYNSADHLDFLPTSVRSLENTNNYMLPVGTMPSADAYQKRIRLRLWLAPYTKAVFSSEDPFTTDLGFTTEQLGNFHHKQYHLANDKPYYLPVMIAKKAPNETVTRSNFKMSVGSSTSSIPEKVTKIQMVKRDWLNNEKLGQELAERFNQTSRMTNTVFSFEYNKTNKKFLFHFPRSDAIGVVIQCSPDFAHRLGFGSETIIVKGMQALPQEERASITDAQKKAQTVVYDTGPLLCTLDQVSSNTTSGALDQVMAALYPQDSGTLSMPQSVCSCTSNMVHITPVTHASAALVPVSFRLLRIYEDQSIADFLWKCNAYIYGVLQGTCGKKV